MAKIVVIDDESVVRGFTSRLLEMEGHEVISFPDAAPALETCNLEDVDLILTDLTMPTSGEELIKTVRCRGIQTPIIVASATLTSRRDLSDHLKSIGAQAMLEKPFGAEELFHLIEEVLGLVPEGDCSKGATSELT